jgi:hypothetical protein
MPALGVKLLTERHSGTAQKYRLDGKNVIGTYRVGAIEIYRMAPNALTAWVESCMWLLEVKSFTADIDKLRRNVLDGLARLKAHQRPSA